MTNYADLLDKADELAEQERERVLKARAEDRAVEERIIRDRQQCTEIACLDCGELIPDERLQAYPSATLCVDCKRIQDRVNRLYV